MTKVKTRKKAVKAVEKAVRKAVHKGVTEGAVEQAVEHSMDRVGRHEKSVAKKDADTGRPRKEKSKVNKLAADGDLDSDG